MPDVLIPEYLEILRQAFHGNDEHSLLGNLTNVRPDDWRWTPEDGGRSIAEIVWHAGSVKWVYENHTFGDRSLGWDAPLTGGHRDEDLPAMRDWLIAAQEKLTTSLATLTDDALDESRPTHYGGSAPIRWLLNVLLQHDLYHAGEINHLRALRQRDDHWPGDSSA